MKFYEIKKGESFGNLSLKMRSSLDNWGLKEDFGVVHHQSHTLKFYLKSVILVCVPLRKFRNFMRSKKLNHLEI